MRKPQFFAAVILCGLGIVFSASGQVASSDYPSRPIRIVSPGPAGGGTDIAARLIGQKLTEQWGQQVLVDNRGGAGGIIGMDLVAKATPDGYSLILVYGSFFITPFVHARLPYDPVADFAPVIHLFNAPLMIAANPRVPAKNLKELIALAKRRPGVLTYSTPGVGSGSHLGGELLNHMASIRLLHVPYKGTAPSALMRARRKRLPIMRSGVCRRWRPCPGASERASSRPSRAGPNTRYFTSSCHWKRATTFSTRTKMVKRTGRGPTKSSAISRAPPARPTSRAESGPR